MEEGKQAGDNKWHNVFEPLTVEKCVDKKTTCSLRAKHILSQIHDWRIHLASVIQKIMFIN